jgi:hypothetical protein
MPLQDWIHAFEEGKGAKFIKVLAATLVFFGMSVVYDMRAYKNFSNAEAMETGQLARNLAEGKGFTTLVVRPLSIYLVQQSTPNHDPMLKGAHPDLVNPPVYPLLLAGVMKATTFKWTITDPRKKPFTTHQPEILISVVNKVLFFIAVVVFFFLARRLFDDFVAWTAALLFGATELYWRFTISGLSQMLLLNWFLLIVLCLVMLEEETRGEQRRSVAWSVAWSVVAGLLLGVGCLTRYSFGFLVVPVAVFLGILCKGRRVQVVVGVLAAFLVVVSPWVSRNYKLSGALFGVAGFSAVQNTIQFPDTQLERSLDPTREMRKVRLNDYTRKFFANAREMMQNDLPKLGGNWISAFFIVGLLLQFNNPGLSRLRWFVLAALLTMFVVQAVGRTHLSTANPEINSENLLSIVAPATFIFGVAFYSILLELLPLPYPELRYAVTGAVGVIVCLPLLFVFLPPKTYPIAYPPYYPPLIQEVASWHRENEMIMSDLPSAVAWYGRRQCMWLTLDYRKDFLAVTDDMKSVSTLYISPKTLETNFLSQMIKDKNGWGRFALESLARGEVPSGFPLKKSPAGFLPDALVLSDWERWAAPKKEIR